MLIPHVVQTEADKVFVNVLNCQTAALSAGDLVSWYSTSPDGVRTSQPATNELSLFVGVADSAIAASGYGLAQAYGYNSAVLTTNDTSKAIVAGSVIVPVASKDYAAYSAAGTGANGILMAGEAYATDSTPVSATKKAFVRAL
jgi:hypothetical protein